MRFLPFTALTSRPWVGSVGRVLFYGFAGGSLVGFVVYLFRS